MGNQIDDEFRAAYRVDGKTHAIDGNRSLARDVLCEFRRRCDGEQTIITGGLDPAHLAHAIDVAAHEVSAQPVRQAQRFFEVHPGAGRKACDALECLLRYVGFKACPVERNCGETHAIYRDTVADRDVVQREACCIDMQSQAAARSLTADNAAYRGHDAGKHQTVLAIMRMSVPIMRTSRILSSRRSLRSSSCGRWNMPRAA